jgi:mannosyl-3-phosphoglycerate synthase
VYIDTVKFSHILETDTLDDINYFLSRTAFVISHKSESAETLQGVLWYLPIDSPVIVVTNSPLAEMEHLKASLKENLVYHRKVYVVHQKDETVARFFADSGVHHILGNDNRVIDGKGEGMYIGTLFAALLGYPQWIIFYDADNLVPCALLEYTLAMGRLFTASSTNSFFPESSPVDLHNVRICWASKPEVRRGKLLYTPIGRCTAVVSPLLSSLLEGWFGMADYPINSSNAGEQGLSMATAKKLRFSSSYSIETFQFLELFSRAAGINGLSQNTVLQQYQSKSPHFHTKRNDEHVRKMIAQSLGCFFIFQDYLPSKTVQQLNQVCDKLRLDISYPLVYPAIEDLPLEQSNLFPVALHEEEVLRIGE